MVRMMLSTGFFYVLVVFIPSGNKEKKYLMILAQNFNENPGLSKCYCSHLHLQNMVRIL